MVLDFGGGRCEVAVISMAVSSPRGRSRGGPDLDQRIVAHLKHRHRVLIGERTAERIKVQTDRIHPAPDGQIEILARDMASETLKRVRRRRPRDPRHAREPDHADHPGDEGNPRLHPAAARKRRHRPRHHPYRRRLAAPRLAERIGRETGTPTHVVRPIHLHRDRRSTKRSTSTPSQRPPARAERRIKLLPFALASPHPRRAPADNHGSSAVTGGPPECPLRMEVVA